MIFELGCEGVEPGTTIYGRPGHISNENKRWELKYLFTNVWPRATWSHSLNPRLSTFPLLDYNDDLEHTHECNCKAKRLSSVAVYVRTWWAHEHDITPYCTAHAVVGPGALNFTCVAICVVSGKTLAKLILFGGDAMAHACSRQSHVQGTKAISIAVWPKSDATPGT